MERVYNFSPGPAMAPIEVLETAQREMLNYKGTGMSIMEISHRSKPYEAMHNKAIQDLREVMRVPDNFKILMMQGGGTLQFACTPLNLLHDKKKANYLITGAWSEKSVKEAERFCTVNVVADGKASNYSTVPDPSTWNVDPEGAYFYFASNETMHGVEFDLTEEMLAKIGDMPIVVDTCSNFLSRPIDWSKIVATFAGAPKNASSGISFVIVREDMLGHALKITPTQCDWTICAANNSMYNTPPCFSIYMCGLYFEWMKRSGGIDVLHAISRQKAALIYDAVSESNGFYNYAVVPAYRSNMNVPFFIKNGDKNLEKKFCEEAEKLGLYTLTGHRFVGGIRVSLYNGMPIEGAAKLAEFMKEFCKKNIN